MIIILTIIVINLMMMVFPRASYCVFNTHALCSNRKARGPFPKTTTPRLNRRWSWQAALAEKAQSLMEPPEDVAVDVGLAGRGTRKRPKQMRVDMFFVKNDSANVGKYHQM